MNVINISDNSIAPIIAIDFDETINVNGVDRYPRCGVPRDYSVEVINFMHKIGIKIVIWTSRDIAYNQEQKRIHDHISPMVEFFNKYGIKYDAINKSVEFAPYLYNGRKVYAHMYVDDRGFGWKDNYTVFLSILYEFMVRVCKCTDDQAQSIVEYASLEYEPEEWMYDIVRNWNGGRGNG